MKEDDDLQLLLQLRDTIRRLRSEIRLLDDPVHKSDGFGSSAFVEDAAANQGFSLHSRHRRELQSELQDTLHRLAETLEMARIETVARQAVESGMVTEPFQLAKVGKCPLCFEEIPEQRDINTATGPHRKFPCCGVRACEECSVKFLESNAKSHLEAQARMLNLPPPENELQAHIVQLISESSEMAGNEPKSRCPFCRSDLYPSQAEERAMVHRNAGLGMAWAQREVGEECFKEYHNTKNVEAKNKGIHWFSLAAEQGDLGAQTKLAIVMSKSNEINEKPFLPVARQGHDRAQHLCGMLMMGPGGNPDLDLNDEPWMWMTLAAAQGIEQACHALGQYWTSVAAAADADADAYDGEFEDEGETCDNEVAIYRAYYWYKMAAVKGFQPAQAKTATLLLEIKKSLFDGKANEVGYSCYPEVLFWTRQGPNANATAAAAAAAALGVYVNNKQCACCCKRASGTGGKRGDGNKRRGKTVASVVDNVKIRLCTKCHSIGYCSRECQKKHWHMGHKTDCQAIDLVEKALEAKTTAVLSKAAQTAGSAAP